LLDKQAGIIVVELIVVHVPKTAGATFQFILNQVYGCEHIYYDYLEDSRPRVYQPAEIPSEFRVIHGHFPIAKYDGFFPDAKRIIWLRHPVHLLVSLYFYWLHLPLVNNNHTIVGKLQTSRMGIDEFSDQPEVRNILYRDTSGKKLSDFYFVGLQEFFQEDLAELKSMLGWANFRNSYENLNPNPKYHEDIQKVFANQKIIDKLVENNQQDLALYQEALNLRANRRKESILRQPIMAEWNRYQYQLRQFTQLLKPTNFNNVEPTVEKTEPTVEKTEPTVEKTEPTVEKTGEASMKEWKRTFVFNKQEFYYNRIRFNNPTERAVEIPIAFNFLAALNQPASILEVGNVLSHYENHLSERLGITSRRIVDKFEVEVGVDNEDLMNLPSDKKYDAIVSLSTVEHIGQKGAPSGGYGEQEENRDLEGPLKAIAKIYDLLAPDGKALITVPFGKLIDGEWYIQFSKEYLYLLGKKYGIPKEAVSVNCLKLIDRETNGSSFNVLWEELDALELSYVEYGSPFSQANAIAVIELSKLSSEFHLKLNVEPSPLLYNMSYETRTEFEQNKALLQQSKSELAEFQRQLQLTQSEWEQSQAIQQQTQSELQQAQLQLHQTQSELEQSQAIQQQTQSELEQSQAIQHLIQNELEQSQAIQQQTQSELEQSQLQLHQTQSELEQSQSLLYQTQSELEQSQSLLYQTQSELEQSQAIQHQTQRELEQSQAIQQQTQSELEQSQAIQQQTQSELEQSQLQLHQTQDELEQSQAIQHQTQSELEQSQLQLHQTQSELEQSQALHHLTQSQLEQSQLQLHQTQSELEQSKLQLHQTQSELEQSKLQLHQTQSELEQSQLQLHQTQSELERLKFSQAMVRESDVKSQMQYQHLLWEGWYAYCKGDRAGMANFLKESLKCTPFSTTETVLNWLETFTRFSSEKGDILDTNTLVNSAEWKELMRRSINGKTALTIH
jgi:SAM-dependent methyltransferase